MSESTSSSGGIGFCGLLTILFIGLKLTGHVDWSWWWVLAPSWIPVALIVGAFMFGVSAAVIAHSRRRRSPRA